MKEYGFLVSVHTTEIRSRRGETFPPIFLRGSPVGPSGSVVHEEPLEDTREKDTILLQHARCLLVFFFNITYLN